MYCTRCGAAVGDNAAFCSSCGQPLNAEVQTPAGAGAIPAPAFAAPGVSVAAPPMTAPIATVLAYPAQVVAAGPYAGFWLRLVAYIIDSAILGLGFILLIGLAAAVVGAGFFRGLGQDITGAENVFAPFVVLMILMFSFVALAGGWIYYAWFESSQYQATPGKLALGLFVTDMEARRVTFARASGRFFAKIITGLIPLFIGYIMAGFTAKKQALHDMIASCLVLRRT
ncbi:MAG TPA: RDD family protein [Candidatus Acidoferrum sp.]|nr:RDD family protein [Candidatus Acidoferrum sp.]